MIISHKDAKTVSSIVDEHASMRSLLHEIEMYWEPRGDRTPDETSFWRRARTIRENIAQREHEP